ncbi:MAG: hypothetical protein Q9225_004667 [Loekoesia sp. 1 TL-2023]
MPNANPDQDPVHNVYGLSRDIAAGARLDLQHYCFKELLGFNVSPQIPIPPDNVDLAIADIGTGTGIWLTDLARELPNARLDGFDSSIDQFPPKAWWPQNVSLRYLDALEPVPEELHGKYDIVNVRLFMFVIQDGDPKPLLANLRNILKPGGFLQWIEHNPHTVRVESPNHDDKRSAHDAIVNTVANRRKNDWVSQLPEHLQDAGFTSVSHSAHPFPPELRMPFTRINLLAGEEVSYVLDDNSGSESSGSRHRALLQEAFEESKNGVCMVWSPVVVVGRRELE